MVFNQGSGETEMDIKEAEKEETEAGRDRKQQGVWERVSEENIKDRRREGLPLLSSPYWKD